ncbi:hypothetical protein HZH68_008047 [Vespula germanica]|uniref:Uncharacterized protein n=1 Tax=Vespula germanica TaxID=30212 RepID=A0A834N8A0_VESGE|nr:hypothetical protein HZH68_008047 [Vespula germanica]
MPMVVHSFSAVSVVSLDRHIRVAVPARHENHTNVPSPFPLSTLPTLLSALLSGKYKRQEEKSPSLSSFRVRPCQVMVEAVVDSCWRCAMLNEEGNEGSSEKASSHRVGQTEQIRVLIERPREEGEKVPIQCGPTFSGLRQCLDEPLINGINEYPCLQRIQPYRFARTHHRDFTNCGVVLGNNDENDDDDKDDEDEDDENDALHKYARDTRLHFLTISFNNLIQISCITMQDYECNVG